MEATVKKTLALFAVLLSVSLSAAEDWDAWIEYGQGLFLGDQWDPGSSGLDLGTMAWKSLARGEVGAGLEFGVSDIAWRVMLPIAYRYEYARWKRLSLAFDVGLNNGVALFRPYPLWLWSASAQNSVVMAIGETWGLGLSFGLSYSSCPQYAAMSGTSYSTLNVPIRAYVRKAFR